MTQRLICLVPARNAAHDLPGFLDSVRRFCDAVIALDDGSTDETRAILEADPVVVRILANPPRPDYQGWDDAANRNRLLDAAAEFAPEWIISLDADERIDEADAKALREFLETDALPGCAYGFRHVPMRGDEAHYLPRYQWVYRLFSYAPGLHFPSTRLHFIPIPTAIPRSRWFRTTLRIQHLGAMTEERRFVRFVKYLEADPNRVYQADYSHLLRTPAEAELRRWTPRPDGLPVLLGALPDPALTGERLELSEDTGDATPVSASDPLSGNPASAPALSVIVISQNDEATIARTMASIVSQDCPEPFEVILVTSGTDRTAAIVREQFPTVTVVELDHPALPGEARNAGLAHARGIFVSFPGSHIELPAGSLKARLRAHRRGYAMVTGVAVNGTDTLAGWASYFLDHHEGLPGHRPARIQGPPAHCSYARVPLLEVGGFPEGVRTAEDTEVNRALVRRGYVAYREPEIQFLHRSPCRTPSKLVRHHFTRGRGIGRLVLQANRERGHFLFSEAAKQRAIRYVPDRLNRIAVNVEHADPALKPHYNDVRLLIALGALASWAGMWWEILRPAPGKLTILLRQPISVIALGSLDPEARTSWLIRLDRLTRRAQVIRLPPFPELVAGRLDPAAAERRAKDRRDPARGSLTDVRAAVEQRVGLAVDTVVSGPEQWCQRLVSNLPRGTAPSAKAASPLGKGLTYGARVLALQRPGVRTSVSRWSRLMLALDLAGLHGAIVSVPAAAQARARDGANAMAWRQRITKPKSARTTREEFWA